MSRDCAVIVNTAIGTRCSLQLLYCPASMRVMSTSTSTVTLCGEFEEIMFVTVEK